MPKILCVSDQVDPLIYDSRVKERYPDIDFIIAAGDLPMEYLDFMQDALNKPLFFVFGSHFLKAFTHYHPAIFKKNNNFKSKNAEYIGFKTVSADGILLAGLSAIKGKKNLASFSERKMRLKLFKLLPALFFNKIRYGRFLDILVTHFPPCINNESGDIRKTDSGFKCLVNFIKRFKPKYVIHGGIHIYAEEENKRIKVYENTSIINSFSHYLLEF